VSGAPPGTLARMRLTALRGAMRQAPLRYGIALAFVALAGWGVLAATRRAIRFVDGYPAIGTIADAVLQRSLEGLFVILMAGVAFSVLTGAITTLYASRDLPLLLSLPLRPERVFGLKTLELFVQSAALPALLTAPALVALGIERGAPPLYAVVAAAALAALYALPVALGAALALLLMRLAPAGRVQEVATGANVVLAAGLVVGLRALRPERLTDATPEQFEAFLQGIARVELGWAPTSWASRATWAALEGRADLGLAALAGSAVLSLAAVARLAAWAYRVGWIRALDTARARRDPASRPAAAWERPLARLGPVGGIVVKDLRSGARDATQWSQLLVLVALAAVYLVSTASLEVDGQRFRDALGTLNLAFLSFLLIGIGVRTTFPLPSLEGEGWWMLRTGPLRVRQIVAAKALQAFPAMAALGLAVGAGAAWLLDLSPALAAASPWTGLAGAAVATGLGIGLGSALPRFDAAAPTEVPLSPGGLAYMGAGLAWALGHTLLLAWPAWQVLRGAPGEAVWTSPGGLAAAGLALLWAVAFTVVPLAIGTARLARWEPGD
jgi:ABC-2 type transport system permease protein